MLQLRIGPDARLHLHVVQRLSSGAAHLEDVRISRFNLGGRESLNVMTTTSDLQPTRPSSATRWPPHCLHGRRGRVTLEKRAISTASASIVTGIRRASRAALCSHIWL